MPRRVLFIGNPTHREFHATVEWLQENTHLSIAENITSAIRQLRRDALADTILIASSYRSQFTLQEIRDLQITSPLSHLCVVVGSWCEGETRSGNAWPGIDRLYVNQLIPRARSERWNHDWTPSLSPDTAGSDERWLLRASRVKPIRSGLVLVFAYDNDSRQSLAELCRWAGCV